MTRRRGLQFADYAALHAWSVQDLEGFWSLLAEYFELRFHAQPERVLEPATQPGAHWFIGATLNYAEHALQGDPSTLVLLAFDEQGPTASWTRGELCEQVRRCRQAFLKLGVGQGDRVVGYLPNGPHAVVALLAAASLGAIWSSCPPEFGTTSVLDRFAQVAPKVLIGVDGYLHGGKWFERGNELSQIHRSLSSDVHLVVLRRSKQAPLLDGHSFDQLLAEAEPEAPLRFDPVPFEHPLWILYSSGTTGKPKAIVHGHGGILLEHLKVLGLHHDLGSRDRFFWYSTTGWMMWNYLVSGLLVGSTIVLYDGSPSYPDLGNLWRLAARQGITLFGASAPFFMACRDRKVDPRSLGNLAQLRQVGSTGAPLVVDGFEWLGRVLGDQVQVSSVSGGTDVCSALVLGCPWLPVRAGELQCLGLGADVQAYSEQGQPLVAELGELVIARPMPSMPVAFWGDADGLRYRASYFESYAGVWRHGDWIAIFEDGGAVISGRSDATLNRGGVRMGTSEFYGVVENLPEIADSLVIERTAKHGSELWLFVVTRAGHPWDDGLKNKLRAELRRALSPRHVPDVICNVSEIPYTLSGKKLELPVKRILDGAALQNVANPGTLRNPAALQALIDVATSHVHSSTAPSTSG